MLVVERYTFKPKVYSAKPYVAKSGIKPKVNFRQHYSIKPKVRKAPEYVYHNAFKPKVSLHHWTFKPRVKSRIRKYSFVRHSYKRPVSVYYPARGLHDLFNRWVSLGYR